MNIVCDIRGWRKKMNVPDTIMIRGYIDIGLLPPMPVLVRANKEFVSKTDAVTIRLYSEGRRDHEGNHIFSVPEGD